MTDESAEHLTRRHPSTATEVDKVDSILKTMHQRNLAENPVTSAADQSIALLTLVDVLEFRCGGEGEDQVGRMAGQPLVSHQCDWFDERFD